MSDSDDGNDQISTGALAAILIIVALILIGGAFAINYWLERFAA